MGDGGIAGLNASELGDLLNRLVCLACHGELEDLMRCSRCGAEYELADGLPILLEPASNDAGKQLQADEFDSYADPDSEARRPRGTPQFHGWLLYEKYRRATSSIGPLTGATVVVSCGGSGMDAELLAVHGARVITCDISPGAARRAQRRARETGLPILSIVADCERLPIADRGVDVAYVHDGLHHIEDPRVGIRELARVAGRAVSISEPTPAAATSLAIRAGIAEEIEDTGNRVARVEPGLAVDELTNAGYEILSTDRYAMYYHHEPGAPMRILSRRRVAPFARAGCRALDRMIGGYGNKMNVQAQRA